MNEHRRTTAPHARRGPVVTAHGGDEPQHGHDYLPGFARDALLPLYDPLTRLAGLHRMHQLLLDHSALGVDDRVLDIGTGTGELALRIVEQRPVRIVIGVDPDPLARSRAEAKATRRGLADRFRVEHGYGDRLGHDDQSFDHVVSGFAYHHLSPEGQGALLSEVRRVLRPGGTLHIIDFGGRIVDTDGPMARGERDSGRLAGNLGDAIPTAMRAAGLVDAAEVSHRVTRRLGRVTLWQASSPLLGGE